MKSESYEMLFESAIKEIDDIKNIFNNKNATVSYKLFKKYIKHLNKNFEESNLKEIYNYLKESSLDRSTPMTVAASLRNSRVVSGNKIIIGNEFYSRSKNMNILYDLKTGIVEIPVLGNNMNLHQLKLLINKFYNFKGDDSYATFEEFIGQNSVNINFFNHRYNIGVEFDVYNGETIRDSQRNILNLFKSNSSKWLGSAKDIISNKYNINKLLPKDLYVKDTAIAIMCKSDEEPEHGVAIVFDKNGNCKVGIQDIIL